MHYESCYFAHYRSHKKQCVSWSARYVPYQLQEEELSGVNEFDKIFASAWVDYESFVVGTKDNRLVRWSAQTGRRTEVTLPFSSGSRRAATNNAQENCGIHAMYGSLEFLDSETSFVRI